MFIARNAIGQAQKSRISSRSTPPARTATASSDPVDTFQPSSEEAREIRHQPNWAPARTEANRAKLSGFQVAAMGLGTLVAFGGLIGVATSGGGNPSPPPAPAVEKEAAPVATEQSQTPEVDLAATETKQAEPEVEKKFSDGRTLLLDRSDRVHSGQFNPDPAQAVDFRANRPVFEESYISSLLDRDLTTVPEGSPRFTAAGVDKNQGSKIYFDSDMQEVGFGYGTMKTGDFMTRPTRMKGRGSGIRDEISQYHLSCVYRLEEAATIDGVKLDAGVYRLITMEPASRVATPSMQRGVCPGHSLKPSGSGISGDYVPTQQSKEGENLHVNPSDIVQIWSLTAEEAANYQ